MIFSRCLTFASLDHIDMAPERGENPSSIARRYLCNAVAWISASSYVAGAVKASSSFRDITLDFVVAPLASPDMCASEKEAVDSGITFMLKRLSLDCQSEIAESLIERFKKKVLPVPVVFCGTVHCEASLMGMIVACMDDTVWLPDGVKREELEAFKVLPNGFYMSYVLTCSLTPTYRK